MRLLYLRASALILTIMMMNVSAYSSKAPLSAKSLYQKALKNYLNDDLEALGVKTRSLHLAKDNQVFADNAYYLLGRLQLKKGQVSQALKTFNTLESKFPHSNKRVAALFAKATIYKRLKLNKLAKKSLIKVIRWYPGSMEAKRARLEMKAL